MANEGIELHAYSYSDPTNLIDIIPVRGNPQVMEELDRVGKGKVTIPFSARGQNAIQENNYIKVLVDGNVTGGFVVQEKDKKLLNKGEDAQQVITVGGEGPLTWFKNAVVLPEGGLKNGSFDNRSFNFATARGTWYQSSDWATPVQIYKQNSNISHSWRGAPKDFPEKTNAWWIWSVPAVIVPGPHTSGNMPRGVNHFRREFTTAARGTYTIYIAADDKFEAFVDGQKISDEGGWGETTKITFDLEPGSHTFGARVTNVGALGAATAGPAGLVMAMYANNEDTTGPGSLVFSSQSSGWQAATYNKTPGWTPGDVLNQLLTEAHGRGVRFPGWLRRTFTATHDSNGVAWDRESDWQFKVGTDTYMSVIERFIDFGINIWIDPDTLDLHAAKVRGTDKTTPANTIALYEGRNLLQADASTRADIKNNLYVKNKDGWHIEADENSTTKYGVLEGKMEIDLPSGEARKYATDFLGLRKQPEESTEYSLIARPGAVPWVDFKVGDWVMVITSHGPARRRVVSISVTEEDSGDPSYAVEFDTIFLDKQQELEKKIERLTSEVGTSSLATGGKVTTSYPTKGSDKVIAFPLPVSNLTVATSGYWTESGTARSEARLEWVNPLVNDDGSPVDGALRYEVWGVQQRVGATGGLVRSQRMFTTVDENFANLPDLLPRSQWSFSVRSINLEGSVSPWVTLGYTTMPYPLTKLDPPTKPTLSSEYGLVIAAWDGKLAQGVNPIDPPKHLSAVLAYVSATENGTYTQMGTGVPFAGDLIIPELTKGSTVWVKLKAIDILGTESNFSAAASIKVDNAIQEALDAAQQNLEDAIDELGQEISAGNGAVTNSPNAPVKDDGTNKPNNAMWYQFSGTNLIGTWRWNASTQTWEVQKWASSALAAEINADLQKAKDDAAEATSQAGDALAASETANGKISQSLSAPVSGATSVDVVGKPQGAIWYRFNAANELIATYKLNGSTWVEQKTSASALTASLNTEIAKAQQALETATSADGKQTVSTAAPTTANGSNKPTNALWYQYAGNVLVGTWRWTGSAWSAVPLGEGAIANSAITSDKLANAIKTEIQKGADAQAYASALLESAQNRVIDPSFSSGLYPSSGVWFVDTANGSGRTDNFALRNNAGSSPTGIPVTRTATGASTSFPVEQGQVWEVSGWYRTTADWNGTAGNSKLRLANQSNQVTGAANSASLNTSWTQVSSRITIGSTVTALQLTIVSDNTAGSIWWDDISLKNVTEAAAAQKAANDAADSATAAAGKITLSTAVPSTETGTGKLAGSLWYQIDANENIIGMWEWKTNSGPWQKRELTDAVIATLDAGKINTGYLNAARIKASSIAVSQLMIGDFEDLFEDRSLKISEAWIGAFSLIPRSSPNQGANMMVITGSQATSRDVYSTKVVDVLGGEKIAVSGQVYTGSGVAGTLWIGARVTLNTGTTYAYPRVFKFVTPGGGTDTIEGVIDIPINAIKVQLFLSTREGFTNNAVTNWHSLSAKFQKPSTLIENGAITTDKMTVNSIKGDRIEAGTLDALKITANTIDSRAIKAGSISAEMLAIGDFTNLVDDPTYSLSLGQPTSAWQRRSGANAATTLTTTTGLPGRTLQLFGVSSEVSAMPGTFQVQSSQKYFIEFRAQNSLTGSSPIAYIRIYWYQHDMAQAATQFSQVTVPVSEWTDYNNPVANTFTSPANAKFGRVVAIHGSNNTGGSWWLGNISVRRVSGGTLIENGAITTEKMTANSIKGDRIETNTLAGGKIIAGSIESAQIKAGSIFSDRLAVGNFDNLIEDPAMTVPLSTDVNASPWKATTGVMSTWSYQTSSIDPVRFIRATAASGNGAQRLANRNKITVTTGDRYVLSARAVSNITGTNAQIGIVWRTGSNVYLNTTKYYSIPSTGEWDNYSFMTDPAPVDAVYAEFELHIPAAATGGAASFGNILWQSTVGRTLIQNGAISTDQLAADSITAESGIIKDLAITNAKIAETTITSAKISEIDAAKIKSGYILAARIQSNTITTDKLLVGDVNNYIPDEGFSSLAVSNTGDGVWYKAEGGELGSTRFLSPKGTAWRLIGSANPVTISTTEASMIKVTPGAEYRFSMWFHNQLTGSNTSTVFRFQWYNLTGNPASIPTSTVSMGPTSDWQQVNVAALKAPADAEFMRFSIQKGSGATGGITSVAAPSMRAKTPSVLIEDGAITATKITVDEDLYTKFLKSNLIKTEHLDAGAITSKHTITGAVFQTTATASRGIKFDSFGLNAYNSSGLNTFSLSAATGALSVTGSLSTTAPGTARVRITQVGTSSGLINFEAPNGDTMGQIFSQPDPTVANRGQIVMYSVSAENTVLGQVHVGKEVVIAKRFAPNDSTSGTGLTGTGTGNSSGITIGLTTIDMEIFARTSSGNDTGAALTRLNASSTGVYMGAGPARPGAPYISVGSSASVMYVNNAHRLDLLGDGNTRFWATGRFDFNRAVVIAGAMSATGTKNFIMRHPVKEDQVLKHASTESPYNGVEYWSEEAVTIPESGSVEIELPDYFEALTKGSGRTVFLTALSKNAELWHEGVKYGKVVVHGTPGAKFDWLVKAIRQQVRDGVDTLDFDVEYDDDGKVEL